MDIQPSGVLLSDLPLSIIHTILALVPVRDAVRTSVLSRQWRYTWATLPHLVFDDECVSSSEEDATDETSLSDASDETSLIHFITQALLHHKGPIHTCKISVSFKSNSPDIDEWIVCLSKNDIKELTLYMGDYDMAEMVQVPSSIYSCEKLTKLELWNCDLDPPPSTFKGFLFLRRLFLRDVCLSPNAIESLAANSPLLETFGLWDVSFNKELRISAPNLKYLEIRGDHIELCVYAPLLVGISVSTLCDEFTTIHQQQKSLVCNYANFMGGFTNLEKLSGSEYFTKYLSMGIESCHHTVVFHQLKHVELVVNFRDIKAVSVIARLIVGAPNLEKLIIDTCCYDDDDESEEDDESEGDDEPEARLLSFRDFGCGPNFTFEKLRAVEMSPIRGRPLEMEFVEFLLESSPVLETMYLGRLIEGELNLAAELLEFCRASSKAKIFFRYFKIFF